MRERLTSAFRRGTRVFTSFTTGQKAVTVFAVLVLGVGGYFFANWAGQPTYAPLFTNLAAADASAIVDKLTADGVSYQITNGGSTIMVPTDQVYAERIKLSGQGLPASSDAGYALLDKQGAMTSDFMQQVGYRRALEGELAKTIKSIDGVTAATVHLAIPAKDVFADDQTKPTASVLVATAPGKGLDAEQVQAVVHLVASSVEGLEPEQVTVVGADGSVLSAAGQTSAAAGDLRTRQTQDFQQRMNTALQHMLDQALGPGHAVVQVTADLDFDSTETTTQKYVPDPSAPPLSESKKNETYNGTGTPAGGVLGPDNIQVPSGGTGGSGSYSMSSETRNNAVSVITETRKSAPGAIRRLSVAVLVDNSVAKDSDASRLQQLVSSAAGLDATRGDTISVTALKFDKTAAKQNKDALAQAQQEAADQQLKSWIETGAVVLGVLVLLVVAVLSSRKKRESTELTADELEQLEEMQAAIEQERTRQALEGGAATPAPNALGAGSPASPGNALEQPSAREARQREINTLVERQPDEVAQLLRGWLADRRG